MVISRCLNFVSKKIVVSKLLPYSYLPKFCPAFIRYLSKLCIAAAAVRPAVAVPIAAQPAVAVSAAVQPSVAETCRRPALPAGNLPPSSPTCPIVYLRLGTRFDLAPHPGSDFVRVVSGSTRLPSAGLV